MATCKDNLQVREKLVGLLIPVLHDYSRAAACMEYLIANGVTVQEWVSVEDRLPEQFESVIGWTVFGEIGEVEYTGKRFISAYDYDVAQVTHWMPLPTPPKGE